MPKNKNNNIGNYKVLTGDWWANININHDIFDDPYVEACTQAMEQKVKGLKPDDDLHVNPVMVCKNLNDSSSKERYINTYKILLNAGMPTRAALLRNVFMKNIEVDLASEPMSASMKRM
jgi:hypothetical protein